MGVKLVAGCFLPADTIFIGGGSGGATTRVGAAGAGSVTFCGGFGGKYLKFGGTYFDVLGEYAVAFEDKIVNRY